MSPLTSLRRPLTFIVVATSLLTLGACGSTTTPSNATSNPASTSPTAATADATKITLADLSVTMKTTFKPGTYTFTIKNDGALTHELLVFRSNLTPDKFPTEASGDMAEDGPGIEKVSDGDNLDPGQSQTRTVDLSQPGTYVFACNLPGHFAGHMYAQVTVAA